MGKALSTNEVEYKLLKISLANIHRALTELPRAYASSPGSVLTIKIHSSSYILLWQAELFHECPTAP